MELSISLVGLTFFIGTCRVIKKCAVVCSNQMLPMSNVC
jgi:hypothetical protein